MSQTPNTAMAVIGIDIGKNSFHVVGHGSGPKGAMFTPRSAKQRPRTSIGGLQSVFNFGFGAFRAGACTGALPLASGSACLTGNLSLLTVRFTI